MCIVSVKFEGPDRHRTRYFTAATSMGISFHREAAHVFMTYKDALEKIQQFSPMTNVTRIAIHRVL